MPEDLTLEGDQSFATLKLAFEKLILSCLLREKKKTQKEAITLSLPA